MTRVRGKNRKVTYFYFNEVIQMVRHITVIFIYFHFTNTDEPFLMSVERKTKARNFVLNYFICHYSSTNSIARVTSGLCDEYWYKLIEGFKTN